MVSGYPSDATENAVQANIVAAGYGGGTSPTGTVRATGAGRCLDVNNNTTTQGTQLQVWDCNGGANQRWTRTASGELRVYADAGPLCLDACGRGTANGTQAVVWSCNGQNNQQWHVNANGTITSVQSGPCLDVAGSGTANGTKVQLWTCTGASNQQWQVA